MYKILRAAFTVLSLSVLLNSAFAKKNIQTNTTQQKKALNSAKAETGKEIYQKRCMSCHQVDGSGVPGMFPPVQNSDWVIGDKKRIISLVLYGLQGEIVVNDETYNQIMPPQAYLTDEQIAKTLTYIRQNFGNKASIVKASEVAAVRAKKK